MIIEVFPDKQKAKSIFGLAENRENFIKSSNFDKFPTGKMEHYYEIIKELATGIILTEGFKSTGENAHKDLIDFLFKRKFISESEIVFLQDLRIKRNQSSYEGKQIEPNYLQSHEQKIVKIISKLKNLSKEKL